MEDLKSKIHALNDFKYAYIALVEKFDNEFMIEDYPFAESFDEIEIIKWVNKSLKNITNQIKNQ